MEDHRGEGHGEKTPTITELQNKHMKEWNNIISELVISWWRHMEDDTPKSSKERAF